MRLDGSDFEVISSGAKESYDMGVKSPAIIFDILCNRTYRYPLRTMIQEYMSNARDAHREVGKDDVPIDVTLPTVLEPNLLIRDFGPGISPQRMQDVFIYLGASTKRGSNLEHGGFGIGAKIAFAYTDSFGITTFIDGIARVYMAYKGDDGIGHIDLLTEYETEEVDGTQISIAIKSSDHREASACVIRACYFWDVTPIFHNLRYDLSSDKCLSTKLDSPYYVPTKKERSYIERFYSELDESKVHVILDGILYGPVSSSEIDTKAFNNPTFLIFQTGELELSVSREGLQYNQKTVDAINKLVANIIYKNHDWLISMIIDTCYHAISIRDLVDRLEDAIPSTPLSVKLKRSFQYDEFLFELDIKSRDRYNIYIDLQDVPTIDGSVLHVFVREYMSYSRVSAGKIDVHKCKFVLLNNRTVRHPTPLFIDRLVDKINEELGPITQTIYYLNAQPDDPRIVKLAHELGWYYTRDLEKRSTKKSKNNSNNESKKKLSRDDIVESWLLSGENLAGYYRSSDLIPMISRWADEYKIYVLPKRHLADDHKALFLYTRKMNYVFKPKVLILVTRTIRIANDIIDGVEQVELYDEDVQNYLLDFVNNLLYEDNKRLREIIRTSNLLSQFNCNRAEYSKSPDYLYDLCADLQNSYGLDSHVIMDVQRLHKSLKYIQSKHFYESPLYIGSTPKRSWIRDQRWHSFGDPSLSRLRHDSSVLHNYIKKSIQVGFDETYNVCDSYITEQSMLLRSALSATRLSRLSDPDTLEEIADYILCRRNKKSPNS